MRANRRGRHRLDGIEQQGFAKPLSGVVAMSPEPADQHGRNGRIARQLLRQRLRHLVQGHVAGRQGVEARHPIRRNLSGDETGGVFALHVLRDGLAEVAVDQVVAAGEIRPHVRLRQRLDGEADTHRRSISSA